MSGDHESQEEDTKSLYSHAVSPVRFENKTGRRVSLIWVDFQGRQRVQFELETGQGINFNTYVTHPWRAEDTESRNGLLLNFYETFYPPNPEVALVDMRKRRALVKRLTVNITTPVYRLEKYCKESVKRLVQKDKLVELPLPKIIVQDLLDEY